MPLKTSEQIAADADAKIDALVRTIEAIKKETIRRGLGKGKGGHGSMPCPSPGCKGWVRFIVYVNNGHMMASCSVKGCVNVRE